MMNSPVSLAGSNTQASVTLTSHQQIKMNQNTPPRSTGRNQSGSTRPIAPPRRKLPKAARRNNVDFTIGDARDPIASLGRRMQQMYPRAPQSLSRTTAIPASRSTVIRGSVPQMSVSGNSGRASHSEMIAVVEGSALYAILQTISLNPGLPSVFPWLSIQARGWEQYSFRKLNFHYFNFVGSETPGQVRLVPDYDAADPAPISAIASSSYQDIAVGAANAPFSCFLNPRAMHSMGGRKFVRTGPLAANLDIKTYDVGQLFVGSNYGTDIPWGELWVEYEVDFFVPQVIADISIPDSAFLHATSVTPVTGSILPAITVVSGTLGVSVSGTTITFPIPGTYQFNYNAQATTSVTLGGAGFTSTGGLLDAAYGLPPGAPDAPGLNVSGNGAPGINVTGIFVATSPSATLSFGTVTFVLPLGADLTVSLLPSDAT